MAWRMGGAALAAATLIGGPALALPSPAELPDWTGVWQNAGQPTSTDLFDSLTSDPPRCLALAQPCRSHPPYNDHYEARYRADLARALAGVLPDPLTSCMPRGTPANMRSPDGIEFVVRPERVWIFDENGSQSRRIYTDGRPHRSGANAFKSYTGDSIGHWEGDTLVVETVGIRAGMMIDRSGATLSDQAVIHERIRRLDADTMEDQFVIEDPGALTRPWTVRRLYRLVPKGRIFDYACAENQRNPIGPDGSTHTLGPDGKPIQ